MRFLFISDLHIKQNTLPENTAWVAHFSRYITENSGLDPVIVFVLGDVIDQGVPAAFDAADAFFSYIKEQVSPVDIQFIFLPGNHDYCDGDLSPFMEFCQRHGRDQIDFTVKSTWQVEFGQINFILADSMNGRGHRGPGMLSVAEIGNAFKAGKTNVLLLHHRLLFEDISSSGGVVNQYEVLSMLKRLGIHFVLQGHAHFSQDYDLSDDIHVFGVGSMGKDAEEMGEWVENEYDQFVVMSVDGNRVESIDNMLYRGGEKRFASQLLYPRLHDEYSDGSGIPLIEYQSVDGYIARTVMKREEAQDPIARCFNDNSESSLYSVCLREKYTLLIADAAIGKSVELQNLAYALTARGGGVRPVLLQLRDYSGTSIEDFLIRKHPEYATLNPRRFVLILDGYAIETIAKLNLQTEEFTTELEESFSSGTTSEERMGIYQYISESGQTDEKIELLLTALTRINERQVDEEISTSESIQLLSCLKKVSSAPAVCKVIKWFASFEKINVRPGSAFQDEITRIIIKASQLYKAGYQEVFDAVLLFLDDAFDFSMIPYKGAILAFFKETNTQDTMIKKLSVTEMEQRAFLVRLLCETDASLITTTNNLYEQGEINDKFYKEFVEELPEGETFNRCSDLYSLKTGETIAPPVKRIDYTAREKDGYHRFWDSLFDQEVADELLAELLSFYGKEVTIGELKVDYSRYSEYTPGVISLVSAMKRYHLDNTKAADFFNIVGRDDYIKRELVICLQNNREERTPQLASAQEARLLELYQQLEGNLDIPTQYKEDTIALDLYLYLLLKKAFSWASTETVALDLVEIPAHMFVYCSEKEKEKKFDLLESEIEQEKIIERVIRAVDRHQSKYILEDLFYACSRYRITQGKESAFRFCAREDVEDYDKRIAVEYLVAVFGPGLVVDTLLPDADDKLFKVCLEFIRDVDNDLINQQLVERYRSNGDKQLLKEMLNRNMPEGLRSYIEESKKERHPVADREMGFHELTEAIGHLKDPVLIPLLEEATIMLFQPGFQDAEYGSLYNSLLKAYCNCAESCYDEVNEVLNKLKAENKDVLDMVNFCSSTIGALATNYAEKVKKVWSISEVSAVLAQVQIVD